MNQYEEPISFSPEQKFMKKLFLAAYVRICQAYDLHDRQDIGLDTGKLIHAIYRADRDLRHQERNHGKIRKPDCHKIAGYYTYWICKMQPIYVCNIQVYKKIKRRAFPFNALCAMLVSLACVNAANEQWQARKLPALKLETPFEQRVVRIGQLRATLADFLYNLTHCNTTGESLAMQYYYIDITAANTPYFEHIKA